MNMHLIRQTLLLFGLTWLGALWHAQAAAFELPAGSSGMLGQHSQYLQETGAPLTLAQAMAEFAAGRQQQPSQPILSFGIGARPAWVRLPVDNPQGAPLRRLLQIENAWLDRLDVYFVREGRILATYRTGDSLPFSERPQRGRFFTFEHTFDPGSTDIYLRVESTDPMVVPMLLQDERQATERIVTQEYSYGFLYGYLLALLAYNLLIWLGLRNRRHLLYAGFIAAFVLTNIAYTGHGYAWLWPDNVALQRWIIPSLMVLYGVAGLAFARHFLDTRSHFPRTHRAVGRLSALAVALLVAAVAAGSQLLALIVAFAFVTAFSLVMLLLGAMSLRAGHRYSRYFLLASIASMLGTTVTSLTVWGFIPFGEWKYRAVEFGMLADATLLALALASQIRSIQLQHMLAERRASRDPLTGLHNRRALVEQAQQLIQRAQTNRRDLSLIILDIDHFKAINDQHGHAVGDAALLAVGGILASGARSDDIVARWGGEEFLLLLPDTRLDDALAIAERLRGTLAEARVPAGAQEISFTASFGVAHIGAHATLDSLIAEADGHLYQAKHAGRNRVCYAPG